MVNMNNNYWIANHLNLVPYTAYIFIVSTILFLFVGWAHGRYRLKVKESVPIREGIVTAIFALSALILSFSFVTAVGHYNMRTESIRNQALSLDRVYRSSKYLEEKDQVMVKQLLKNLVDARLKVYQNLHSFEDLDAQILHVEDQLDALNEFITLSITRSHGDKGQLANKILTDRMQKLGDAFGDGILNAKTHPAALIERFLFVQLIVGAMLCGYSMAIKKEEDWYISIMYLTLLGFLLYTINCLEFPNQLIRFDLINHELLRFQKLLQ